VNDVIPQLLKVTPWYWLFGLAFFWIVANGLPSSVQFFGDLFPHRRRQSRTLAMLDTIKAKSVAIEIAEKHGIKPMITADEAMRGDIDRLLGTNHRVMPLRGAIANRIGRTIQVSYSVLVASLTVVAMFGMIVSSKDFHWETTLYAPLACSFIGSLIGCYNVRATAIEPSGSISLYLMTTGGFGLIGGLAGLVLGLLLTQGVVGILRSIV
jgi:hypothetical protein